MLGEVLRTLSSRSDGNTPALSAAAGAPVRPALLGLVALVAALVYSPMIRNQYTADDVLIIESSRDLARAPLSTLFERSYFQRYQENTYRPVVTASYMIDHRLGGSPVRVGHAQNMAWHAGVSVLVTLLAARLLPVESELGPLAAGLLFAVHPATSEAALAIGYREDVLAAFFCVAALLLVLKGQRSRLFAALACYALGLFSKENAIVMPALLLMARFFVPAARASARAQIREFGAFAVVTLLFLYVRFGPMASEERYADPLGGTYAATLVTSPRLLAHYLRLVIAPWGFMASYANVFAFGVPLFRAASWLALDSAFLAVSFVLVRRYALIGYGLLWLPVALAPMLQFVPMRFPGADRFMYMPLVGAALAAGGLVDLLEARAGAKTERVRKTLVTAGVAVLIALTVLTEMRVRVWRNNYELWSDTLAQNPHAYPGHYFMFRHYKHRGEREKARKSVQSALDDCPHETIWGQQHFCAGFANALGFLLVDMGDLNGADAAFRQSVRWFPNFAAPVVGLNIVAALEHNDRKKADEYYDLARKITTRDKTAEH